MAARPREAPVRPLVRRFFPRPEPMLSVRRDEVIHKRGPYLVHSGWWDEAHAYDRAYYLAELRDGGFLWVYRDRARRKRWVQGEA